MESQYTGGAETGQCYGCKPNKDKICPDDCGGLTKSDSPHNPSQQSDKGDEGDEG